MHVLNMCMGNWSDYERLIVSYHSILTASAHSYIILEMLKFLSIIFVKEQIFVKEIEESFEIFYFRSGIFKIN
jgi:hypothetical protein